MPERGQYARENEEALLIAAVIGIPLLVAIIWLFFGRYLYSYERLVLYGALSLWGTWPTDWPVLGWISRQFLYFRYTHPKEIGYLDFALKDALIVNGVLLVALMTLTIKRIGFIERNHPLRVFGRSMNLYDYVHQQSPMYPHLRVMWKLRLTARPLRDGLFRMGDSAKEFAIRNRLVNLLSLDVDPVLDEQRAERIFVTHLGDMLPPLTVDRASDAKAIIKRLDNNEKALLAAILPRLNSCDSTVSDEEFEEGLKLSQKLVKQYWVSFDHWHPEPPTDAHHQKNPNQPLVPPPPPVDVAGCDQVLMQYLQKDIVYDCLSKHAYIRTFLYDALGACRKVGKFPPTRFRWLRMLDRRLWLTVNSVGRNTPFREVAGLHAHYLYERKLGKPSEKPQVKQAVIELKTALDNFIFGKTQKIRIWEQQQGRAMSPPKPRPTAREVPKLPVVPAGTAKNT